MVKVRTELVSNTKANKVTYGKGSPHKKYVVIHQTGNTSKGASAAMHSKLQNNGFSASWHETVDDKEAVVNFEPAWQCWHASDGRGPGNLTGYAIEICINSDGDYSQAVENGAQRAAQKLKDFGLGIDRLKQHHDMDVKNRKNCPQQIREGKEGITWSEFKKKVKAYMKGTTPAPVTKPTKSTKSLEDVAQEVSKGLGGWGNDPERSKKLKAAGFNASAVQDRVNEILGGKSSKPSKSLEDVAQDIAKGLGGWGNNPERANKLKVAGFNASAVQDRVNEILSGKSSKPKAKKSVDTVAKEIINGKGNWGNNPERAKKLKAAGYSASAVQKRVNELL